MHRLRLVMLLLGLLMAQGTAAVALVLRDGTVLDYGRVELPHQAGGDQNARRSLARAPEIRQIPMPADALGIGEVIVDPSAGRVYVLPQWRVGQQGVLVLDQETLQPVGFLPNILDVTVPRHPKASHVFLHRVAVDAPAAARRPRADMPVLGMQGLPGQVERIARMNPERLSGVGIVNPASALLACARVRGRGYPGTTRVDDLKDSMRPKRRWHIDAALDARHEEQATRGYATDCWSDGTLLRIAGDPYALKKCAIERPDGTLGPWRVGLRGEGRCAAIAGLPGFVMMGRRIVDLATGNESTVPLFGQPVLFQSGASGSAYVGLRDPSLDGHEWSDDGHPRDGARVGSLVRIARRGDRSISVDQFPLGDTIDRVIALRAIERRIQDALQCDQAGTPIDGLQVGEASSAIQLPECSDVPMKLRSGFTPQEEALARRLPPIDIVGVIGDP